MVSLTRGGVPAQPILSSQAKAIRQAKSRADSSAELAETCLAKNLAKFRTLRLEHSSRKERARGTACELVNRISLLDMVKQLGDRLTVGHRPSANFAFITSTWALQSSQHEAETYRERPSIL